MYDIAIIGAGPAGSTLARIIDQKYRVLLVDKRDKRLPTGSGDKCCGGLLAPAAQKVLARMGLALPRSVMVGPQIFAVRAIDLPNGIEKFYQRFYLNLDRGQFDRWLVSLIPQNVEARFGRQLTKIVSAGNHYKLTLHQGNRYEQVASKIVVGADGASSSVRRMLFPLQSGPRRYLAIQERFHTPRTPPYFSAIFDPEISDFYSWTIPKEDTLILGSALKPGKNAPAQFNRLKEKLAAFGYPLGEKIGRESTLMLRPVRNGQVFWGRRGALLIGEAAGLISPSSAEGLSYAFASALVAARAFDRGLVSAAERYERMAKSLKRNIFLKNIKAPAMYCAPLRKAIMRSGMLGMKVNSH